MLDKCSHFGPELWAGLRDALTGNGTARRTRVASLGDIGVYALVSSADRQPSIRIEGPEFSGISESRFPRMSGLVTSVHIGVPALWDRTVKLDTITLKLTNGDDAMFDALANDILAVIDGNDAYRDMENVAVRITQWQEMLNRPPKTEPSVNEAVGMLGELLFLRDHLIPAVGPEAAINAWLGPLSGRKDFEHNGIGYEVKSTREDDLKTIKISSFEQLDSDGLSELYLVLNELKAEPETGESLLDVFESLRHRLADDQKLASRLEFLVEGSGWTKDTLLENVAKLKFKVDTRSFFRVDGAFPRYTRRDRHPGTLNMAYEIIVSDCRPFMTRADRPGATEKDTE